jgi:predicted DCC family thiol-disulfide oxidoreductase YuxK
MQPAYVELVFVPAGSDRASRLFPDLAPADGPEELVVISDAGGVYREGDAWIMCLYALVDYREWALRLAHPMLRPLARQAFALLTRQRARLSRWLGLASDAEIAITLRAVEAPACALSTAERNGTP